MKQPLISIISVNYNSLEVTCEMLDSIRGNNYQNVEVIVVDNASKRSPKAHINAHYPEVMVIESERNLGFAGGNNLGIKESKGEYLFFLNNDAIVTPDALEKMVRLFETNPKLGIVSPKICYFQSDVKGDLDLIQYVGTTPVHPVTARNRTIGEMEHDTNQYTQAAPTSYAHGCAMMIKRKVLDRVGMMSEDFFLYYEELDWCEQIRKAGFEIYVEPNAKVYHKESYSVQKISTLKTYYINRNRILFMRRHRSVGQLVGFYCFLALFTIPKNMLMMLLKGDFANLKAFFKAISWHWNEGRNITKPRFS